MADFVAGDTGSVYRPTCKNSDGTIIDLTGMTVTLSWIDSGGSKVARQMTIVDAVNGVAEYKFQADELYAPSMQFEVMITDSQGEFVRNVDPLTEIVAPALA